MLSTSLWCIFAPHSPRTLLESHGYTRRLCLKFPEEHDGDVVRVLPPGQPTLFSGEVNANGPVSRQALAMTPV